MHDCNSRLPRLDFFKHAIIFFALAFFVSTFKNLKESSKAIEAMS